MEIQHKNSPKGTYFVDIQMGYVPCRGSAVSHVKPPSIMLLNKVELVDHDVDAYSWFINTSWTIMNTSLVKRDC